MNTIFQITHNPYVFRNGYKFKARNVHFLIHGTETASDVGPKILNSFPREYEKCYSLNEFEAKKKSLVSRKLPK